MRTFLVAVGASCLVLAACAPDVPVPIPVSVAPKTVNIQDYNYLCLQGYTQYCPTDPAADAPGLWLGPQSQNCWDTSDNSDIDGDGFSDTCELNLARAFAPTMAISANDQAGGEPYWVVRPVPERPNTVLIGYLPAYYIDLGCTSVPGCGVFDGGHFGDSEAIFVMITLESSSQHWVVTSAALSEHDGYSYFDAAGDSFAPGLEYTGVTGGPFKVYVAYGKHGNYASYADCQEGGKYETDYCTVGVSSTFSVGKFANLGSYSHQLQNCVASYGQFAGDGASECFWTNTTEFAGWFPGPPPPGFSSDPYSHRLINWGFEPCIPEPAFGGLPSWGFCPNFPFHQ
jgi:hypothetical protein